MSRRGLLRGGAALGAMLTCSMVPAFAEEALKEPPPNAIKPEQAVKKLLAGNARYVGDRPLERNFSVDRYARAKNQFPFACILSCADSRVAPELVFDQRPGELFVVRVAGNFIDDYGLASLEYGIKVLGAPLIVVMGHTGCGAVDATIKVLQTNVELPGHLPGLINAIKPAVERAKATNPPNLLEASIVENVRYNVEKLKAAAPIVSRFVADGKVQVVGGLYTLKTGKVSLV